MGIEKTKGKTVNKYNASSKGIKALGVCLGASNVSIVRVEKEPHQKPRIIQHSIHPHEGNPRKTLISALKNIDLESFDRIATTGRKFRRFVNLPSVSEPEAVEYAYSYLKKAGKSCSAVVSAGGESFIVYVLNQTGRITNVLTGNKCASGTGEFFLQQLRRMDVTLEEASQWASFEEAYPVSGRCSVFCKSDCTHATNKGIAKSKVAAGLCKMMAEKILELLKNVKKENIMITGGTTQNARMIEYLRKEIPGLIIPEYATHFEALGAALWAIEHNTRQPIKITELFKNEVASFDSLPPLREAKEWVEFKSIKKGEIQSSDICILGLDVGSTTTKAVLLRRRDHALLASVYLRTNGDPVGASRECYQRLYDQLANVKNKYTIIGLGICGSGRQIAGLHAMTQGVINEIIAHATGAAFFDPQVDCIFEIGGQDAKYIYLTNGVPSDYAMNEACSAGTGSFLEESAYETLGIKTEDIAQVALQGKKPPNFNDQCAAFISSDIKNAIHEGLEQEDIVAGLVYSICMNYSNRVKGNRPMGKKIFMQGGVCYNHAVPLAMASLLGKKIIVPPEPGLMGAFGVALEVEKRIQLELLKEESFDLKGLAKREIQYGKSFICKGGTEKCDRHCEIAILKLEGQKFPFGGACNRYYNLRYKIKYSSEKLDMVRQRQEIIFQTEFPTSEGRKKIGINKSFLVNTFYPLYANFFRELGYEPILPKNISQKGIDKRAAPFCYPAELAHGFFYSLLNNEDSLDYIFLPHFKSIPTQKQELNSQVCPIVQAEPYYLQTSFQNKLAELKENQTKILSPLLDLTKGMAMARKPLIQTAIQMGISRKKANTALKLALHRQMQCMDKMKELGRKALQDLEANPEEIAVIIFARPYNGFVEEAHMGIPHKLASRGIKVIPFDFLPLETEETKKHMYWGMGQLIIKGARFVKKHPQLFGIYITNFSCGPDSFLLGYFRDIMGQKPSLTLELDNHMADAGLETRIEAFLDIVVAYRQLKKPVNSVSNRPFVTSNAKISQRDNHFSPAQISIIKGKPMVTTSTGKTLPLKDPRVTFLIPSMGKTSSESLAAAFRGSGINALALPPADESDLKTGRAHTSCKECLPLILTTGKLLNYIGNGRKKEEIVVYFMPSASGPCRFGQYHIFLEDLVKKQKLADVAMFSLTTDNSYQGVGNGFYQRGWWAMMASDVMEDIRSMILANAKNPVMGIKIFDEEWEKILKVLEIGYFSNIENQLKLTALQLREIPVKKNPGDVPKISLMGEIFVRRDSLSRQFITERLAQKGFATICASIGEWVHYCDFLAKSNRSEINISLLDKLKFAIKGQYMKKYEKRIKSILSQSGLVEAEPFEIGPIIHNALPFISPDLTCESVLTVGNSLTEVVSHSCGVIAIGPFGCMPNRVSEAILNETMNSSVKISTDPKNKKLKELLREIEELPFLAIESDGSPFPQLLEAKLEAFCLQAERLHHRITNQKTFP